MSWIKESNRPEHLRYGYVLATYLSSIFTAGCAVGMEFKDWQYGGKFDLLDIAATFIGGFLGQIVQLGWILLLFFTIKYNNVLICMGMFLYIYIMTYTNYRLVENGQIKKER